MAWAVNLSRYLPGWGLENQAGGLGFPQAGGVSATEVEGIRPLMEFKVLALSGISANELNVPFVLMGFVWSFN